MSKNGIRAEPWKGSVHREEGTRPPALRTAPTHAPRVTAGGDLHRSFLDLACPTPVDKVTLRESPCTASPRDKQRGVTGAPLFCSECPNGDGVQCRTAWAPAVYSTTRYDTGGCLSSAAVYRNENSNGQGRASGWASISEVAF